MSNKNILVVSQYFYPEQFRINDICEEWVKRGYQVTVLTGVPNYPKGKFFSGYSWRKKRKECYKGINIIRLPIIPRGSNSIMLALNYFSFVFSGYVWKLFTNTKVDAVFTYEVSPMTQALPGVWFSKKRKIPHYIYVMDLWPENVEEITGIHNPILLKQIGKMVDYIYKNSEKIFTSSKSFIESISERGISKTKIFYWPQYAEDFYQPKNKQDRYKLLKENVLNITFAGNIGEAQGLESLIEAAVSLKKLHNEDIIFNIIGDGRNKENLKKIVIESGITEYFNFIDKQPAEKVPEYFSESDVALITLAKNKIFEKTIPAKLQSSMACGMPILVCADGEIQEAINEAKCGFYSNTEDVDQLVDNILTLKNLNKEKLEQLGYNSRSYYEKYFSKEKLLDKMDGYLWEDLHV